MQQQNPCDDTKSDYVHMVWKWTTSKHKRVPETLTQALVSSAFQYIATTIHNTYFCDY